MGFIGRIVLKDFRDVRGDALFGKRTFLVRHGRHATCVASAACWVLGSAGLGLAGPRGPVVWALEGLALGAWLMLVRLLACSVSARRDESVISTLAIVGRSTLALVVVALAMDHARWPAWQSGTVMLAWGGIVAAQAGWMLVKGPRSTLRVPQAFDQPAVESAPAPAVAVERVSP